MGSGVSGEADNRPARHARANPVLHNRDTDFRRALVAARLAAGLTQSELAKRIGTTQSAVARLESGVVTPTVDTLRRLGEVLELQFEITPGVGLSARHFSVRGLTLADLRTRREEMLQIASAHEATNLRVFGSVAGGEADARSDVDLLVDLNPDLQGFPYLKRLEELQVAFSRLLRRDVDVVDARSLGRIRERVLREAVPV